MAKIIYVITKGNWGGAQRYVYDLATSLKAEHKIKVALGAGETLEQKLAAEAVPVIKIKRLDRDIRITAEVAVFFELLKLFKTERPDIVHLNSSKSGGLGALAARLAAVPKIIFTAHGFAFDETRPRWQKVMIGFLSWLTVWLATDTIVLIARDLKQTRRWPFVKSKIHLIPNGITGARTLGRAVARFEILRRLGCFIDFLENKTVVGTIAELHRNKGLEYAVEAVASIPNVVYLVIGEGEERARLEKMITEKGGRVFLLGFIPDASSLLSAFDIFLLPSIKEGLPYVILEAGQANLPVVASAVGGIPDVIQNNETGLLVKPKNPADIARQLEFLISHPAERRRLGENLRQKVSREFSPAAMVKATLTLYNE
ncbi:MAG: glycosyltransferase [Candidatus Vogelbacteria bacterium]|nr:glycosyltransferase [Candidatus Vogelbacteria bacterium]